LFSAPCLAVSNGGAGVSPADDGETSATDVSTANKNPSLVILISF
jgi:hypothetical protein